MSSLDNLINMLVTAFLTLASAFLGFKASSIGDKNDTSRKMLEKVYFPIFNLIEKDLFQEISLQETLEYGSKVTAIINENPMYVYPSIRLYAERLKHSSEDTYRDNFRTFCFSLNKNYDKCSKRIGLPLRSYSYRLNTSQYENKYQLFFYLLMFKLPEFIFLAAMLLIYLANKNT